MITSSAIPFTNFALLESLKSGRPGYLHSGVVIAILLLGQLILVGAATNLFYIPLYAIARWSQVRVSSVSDMAEHDLGSPFFPHRLALAKRSCQDLHHP